MKPKFLLERYWKVDYVLQQRGLSCFIILKSPDKKEIGKKIYQEEYLDIWKQHECTLILKGNHVACNMNSRDKERVV